MVEAGSVTAGAEAAMVSQPAVSRAIMELESSLGLRLLERGPRGITATEAGKVLLEHGRQLRTIEQAAEEAMRDLAGLRAGRLRIGASTTVGDHLLPSAITAFCQRFPGVELSLDVANTEAIHDGVASGAFDVGYTEGTVDYSRFKVSVFAHDQLVVVCSPQHSLASKGTIGVEDLAGQSFVMREHGSGTRVVAEEGLRALGIEWQVVASLGSSAAVRHAVAQGLGLGVISLLALDEAPNEVVRLDTPLNIQRDLHRVTLPWKHDSRALQAFEQTQKSLAA